MEVDWGQLIVAQLEFYWDVHLRPRLDGLTDAEYFWEPVEGCWSLRQRADGNYTLDSQRPPPPAPAPVTTLAWRMMHVGAYCLWNRASAFFGGDSVPDDADMFDPRRVPASLPATASEAIAFLGDALRGLVAREPTASCAVISRHAEQADAYFEGLRRAEVPALRRVRRDEFTFQPGVDVTDVAQVKGLEFDYVIMIDVNATSYPAINWARHLLHIGVTRAAHQLWLVSVGEPSPLVPAVLRDGGRMSVG